MAGEHLPRDERLRGRDRYRRLMSEVAASVEDAYLVIRYLPIMDGGAHRHVGVAVSRHCRGAAVRNRLRRRLKEIYRHQRDLLPPAGDFMIIAKSGAQHASYHDLARSFEALGHELVQ